jgi:hypothetical protein
MPLDLVPKVVDRVPRPIALVEELQHNGWMCGDDVVEDSGSSV